MEYNDILGIFAQVPLVALFAWFVLTNNREWRRYLTCRNEKLEKALQRIADAVERK